MVSLLKAHAGANAYAHTLQLTGLHAHHKPQSGHIYKASEISEKKGAHFHKRENRNYKKRTDNLEEESKIMKKGAKLSSVSSATFAG